MLILLEPHSPSKTMTLKIRVETRAVPLAFEDGYRVDIATIEKSRTEIAILFGRRVAVSVEHARPNPEPESLASGTPENRDDQRIEHSGLAAVN